MSSHVKQLLKEIRDDKKYRKFQKVLEVAQSRINLEKDWSEALALHASRTSRTLYGDKMYSTKRLINASANDLSARSRLVEIRVQVNRHASYVRDGMKSLSRHLSTEYASELKAFRNEPQRKALMDRVMQAAHEMLSEVDDFTDMIESLIKDIDQSSHSLRHLIDCLKLLDSAKSGRVV